MRSNKNRTSLIEINGAEKPVIDDRFNFMDNYTYYHDVAALSTLES